MFVVVLCIDLIFKELFLIFLMVMMLNPFIFLISKFNKKLKRFFDCYYETVLLDLASVTSLLFLLNISLQFIYVNLW